MFKWLSLVPLCFVIAFFSLSLTLSAEAGGDCLATPDNGITVYSSSDMFAIQQAVSAAADFATVKVAGSCVGVQALATNFSGASIARPITVRGGYDGTNWNISAPETNETILDSDLDGRAFFIETGNVTIENFTITGGLTDFGAGIRIAIARHGAVTLRSLLIHDNIAQFAGGGVYSSQADLTVDDVRFVENQAGIANGGGSGGGLYANCQVIDGIPCGQMQVSASLFDSNNANSYGGGIEVISGTLSISTTNFVTNTVDSQGQAGGLYVDLASVTVEDSTFSGNQAPNGQGGAIHNRYGSVDMSMVQLVNNSAENGFGGAIYNGRELTLNNAQLSNNSAFYGGAFYGHGFEMVMIDNSTIANNRGEIYGGGIFTAGMMSLKRTSVLNNHSQFSGGGIYNDSSGDLTIRMSTIATNSVQTGISGGGGGGLFNAGVATLVNSTMSDNTSENEEARNRELNSAEIEALLGTGGGGAIWNNDGTVNLTHVTIANNEADVLGGYLFGGGIHSNANSILNMTHTLFADNIGGDCINRAVLATNVDNWVADATCSATFSGDAQLLPLADNGGPTLTHALQPASSAIDGAASSTDVTTDQRGVTRPQGVDNDIGAFEWTLTPLAVTFSSAESTFTHQPVTLFSIIVSQLLLITLLLSKRVRATVAVLKSRM